MICSWASDDWAGRGLGYTHSGLDGMPTAHIREHGGLLEMGDALSHADDGDGMDRRIHRQDARCASLPAPWMARLASVRVMEEATRRQIGRRDRLGEETDQGKDRPGEKTDRGKRQNGEETDRGKRQTGGKDGRRRPCWNTHFLHISQSWYNDIAPTPYSASLRSPWRRPR
jgi:hypothetical protein